MLYALSDLHGNYRAYRSMLERISFSAADTLYVLGDVIDRGPDGLLILQDMMRRPNVIPLLGNHELTAAVCIPWLLEEITDESLSALDSTKLAALSDWIANGGSPTLRALQQMDGKALAEILEYIREMSLYEEVETAHHAFVLVHAGLDHFSPEKPLDDYALTDFLFCRPGLGADYYPDRYLVYGHTPTQVLLRNAGEPPADEILFRKTQIALDCGCGFGGRLGCLCLDTLATFYV